MEHQTCLNMIADATNQFSFSGHQKQTKTVKMKDQGSSQIHLADSGNELSHV